MGLFELFIEIVVISSSGVFAPGPLTLATIVSGTKNGEYSGLKVSLGHMTVEFPLVLLIAFGVLNLLKNILILKIIGITGLIIFILLGAFMIRDGLKGTNSFDNSFSYVNPFLIGVIFSATNAHFMIWWILVGSIFIKDAIQIMGLIGIVVMYIFHVWLDFAWLFFLTFMAARGKNILKTRGYRVFLIAMGVFIIAFGIYLAMKIFELL